MPVAAGALPDALGLSMFASVLVLGLPALLVGRSLLHDVREHLRCKRAARSAAKEGAGAVGAVLAAGDSVVFGTVELAKGEEVAARVEIDQVGSEKLNSGTYFYTWTEVGRRVTMRPFYLRHASGQRVRVEPSSQAFLVDALDGLISVDEVNRTRTAELTPGERVFAGGLLRRGPDPESDAQAYRGQGGSGWVLTPPPDGDLLLSSENLELRFQRQAGRAFWCTIPLTIMLLGILVLGSGFLERQVLGVDLMATALSSSALVVTDSEGDKHTEYSVRVSVGSEPVTLIVDADSEWYNAVKDGMTVPLRFVASHPARSALGHGARLPTANAFGIIPLLFTGTLLTAFLRARARRWFEGKLEDTGKGRLAENGKSVSTS